MTRVEFLSKYRAELCALGMETFCAFYAMAVVGHRTFKSSELYQKIPRTKIASLLSSIDRKDDIPLTARMEVLFGEDMIRDWSNAMFDGLPDIFGVRKKTEGAA